MSEFQSFNVIDKDHVLENNKSSIEVKDIIIESNIRNRSPKSSTLNTIDINTM